jgi:hypothetical protein
MSNEPRCNCGDREASKCPGEWEPGCDLGANPKYAKVVPLEQPEALRLADDLELNGKYCPDGVLQDTAAELRRQNAEIERLTVENAALHQGIEFANRLVETLKGELERSKA